MDILHSVLLYSKYSVNCNVLMKKIKQLPSNDMRMLCVDNEKIRKQIKNDEQLVIKMVPCILIIYSNGSVEQYEGDHAFNYIEAMLKIEYEKNRIEYEKLEQERAKQRELEREVERLKEIEKTKLAQQPEDDLDHKKAIENLNEYKRRQNNSADIEVINSLPNGKHKPTSIGDLELTDEREQESGQLKEPKKKPNESQRQQSNIMDLVNQMAKDREVIDRIKPAGPQLVNRP